MRSTGLKKYNSVPHTHFHCLCLATVTFEVICTYTYLINICQVVSSQTFLFHLVETSPALPRPLAVQSQTSPDVLWPSKLACFRCTGSSAP